jgi:hypothetical protein
MKKDDMLEFFENVIPMFFVVIFGICMGLFYLFRGMSLIIRFGCHTIFRGYYMKKEEAKRKSQREYWEGVRDTLKKKLGDEVCTHDESEALPHPYSIEGSDLEQLVFDDEQMRKITDDQLMEANTFFDIPFDDLRIEIQKMSRKYWGLRRKARKMELWNGSNRCH